MGDLILNALIKYATSNPAVIEKLIESVLNALIAKIEGK